ncbi:hypothetical protein DB30_04247 [Enhygromyxa salina]|uniref:VWFA domain-containing protein n=1 Tax=Enhygromyxa salina TaxID=215803 RepID=A0A0C1ZZM3_9BACT|nr:VWA domain-containing protein [Enhygromyxa salina]KIG16628.1 hypothetical protein DB30_04247 [Enhygromyxa salina]
MSLVAAFVGASGCSKTIECLDLPGGCADDGYTHSETVGETVGETEGDPTNQEPGLTVLTVNKDVDILFVIDNSGSMGEEQALLATSVGAIIDVLEDPDVGANYRIGITTTDNGNPWCPSGATTPEAGKLVASSCKSRLGDFSFNNSVDVQDLACNDICPLSQAELEILPTTTDVDANAKPRPWLESIAGAKNIPDAISMSDAFACIAPQGINGCGFESQLESMYLALIRTQNADEASYGFLRSSAILAVIFLTDEADCSYNKSYSEIFEQDGNKVFWSDPAASFPTSAVCWNAGVECSGDPSNYASCDAVNKDVNGQSNVSDANAVLHPLSRYIGLLDDFEQQKQELNAEQEIIVGLIGGVDNTGEPYYADVGGTNPVFQNTFGIGPGCEAPNPSNPNEPAQAVPPVRLRDVVEAFTPGNMFSICESDYSGALDSIVDRIRDQLQPACYTQCVLDSDPATPLVEPTCTVEEDPPGNANTTAIEECLRDANGYVIDPQTNDYTMPGGQANVCYALLSDKTGLTPSAHDDMSAQCIDAAFNLEFKIARRPGFPAVGGTSITATCSVAEFPEVDCPGIGG